MRFRMLLITFFVSTVLIVPIFALAQTSNVVTSTGNPAIDALNKKIAEKRAAVKELEDSMEKTKKIIEEKQLQSTTLKNQVALLDNHITQLQLTINITKTKLDTITLQIQELQIEITEKETAIDKQKKIIASLLRQLQYQDRKTSLEVLASYKSFSEFYSNVHYLQTIQSQIEQGLRSLRESKQILDAKKKMTLDEQQSYTNLKLDLENQKKDLDDQVFSKQNLLSQTRSSELTYRSLLSNLKSQYQKIENEISSIEQDVRKKLEEENKIKERISSGEAGSLFSWPVPSRSVSAYFHDPSYPFRNVFEHNAIDIRASQGTPIRAAASGYVAQAKFCTKSSCYSYVLIIHDGGLATVYGHMSQIVTSIDKFVVKGDIIGYSGGTPGTVGAGPFVTGPHLHFEVRKDGIPVNPLAYLASS